MVMIYRFRASAIASSIHLLCSLAVAFLAAILVFGLWYPFPYRELSGGRELFLLIVSVDIVCGPLLTMVLFNPAKPRAELWRDLSLVALVQLGALGFGLYTVWQARPLFLVHEMDRFKVVMAPDLDSASVAALPETLRPHFLSGPIIVGIREPLNVEEKNKVLFASIKGGRDYAERPEFYLPYNDTVAFNALKRAKPLSVFLKIRPDQLEAAQKLAAEKGSNVVDCFYLPIIARQEWVAVLDKQGKIQGFLRGDGF